MHLQLFRQGYSNNFGTYDASLLLSCQLNRINEDTVYRPGIPMYPLDPCKAMQDYPNKNVGSNLRAARS